MAIPAGLEPATCCLEGSCSIQLSYGTVTIFITVTRQFFQIRLPKGLMSPCLAAASGKVIRIAAKFSAAAAGFNDVIVKTVFVSICDSVIL